jgi:alpha-beta hydrolase superfamily lysophospholipase
MPGCHGAPSIYLYAPISRSIANEKSIGQIVNARFRRKHRLTTSQLGNKWLRDDSNHQHALSDFKLNTVDEDPMKKSWRRLFLHTSMLMALFSMAHPTWAAADKSDVVKAEYVDQDISVTSWSQDNSSPRAIVLAIHGMTLHGGTYDRTARALAGRGVTVIAPDMRGFGRNYDPDDKGGVSRVDYTASMKDVVRILTEAKQKNPGIPVYCMGESIGANLSVKLAGQYPQLVDGLILSSPCIKLRWHVSPRTVLDVCHGVFRPNKPMRLQPHVEPHLSHNPQVVHGYANDPLIRKKQSLFELVQTLLTNRKTIKTATELPANLPVLIIEGTEDQIYDPASVAEFASRLKTRDLVTFWALKRGHLLLETSFVEDDVLKSTEDWIDQQIFQSKLVAERKNSNFNADAGSTGRFIHAVD